MRGFEIAELNVLGAAIGTIADKDLRLKIGHKIRDLVENYPVEIKGHAEYRTNWNEWEKLAGLRYPNGDPVE